MNWDIKIYQDKGILQGTGLHNLEEMETIRGLTKSQMLAITSVLTYHNIKYNAVKVD